MRCRISTACRINATPSSNLLPGFCLARSQASPASYVDPNGVPCIGLQGEEVLVHADHVARFDKVNGAPEDTPAPKSRKRAAQGLTSPVVVGVKPVRCHHGQARSLLASCADRPTHHNAQRPPARKLRAVAGILSRDGTKICRDLTRPRWP
jgi:hypothetical protein